MQPVAVPHQRARPTPDLVDSVDPGPVDPGPVEATLRVVVAAKHSLVRDAVCTALSSQAIIAEGIGIPGAAGQFHEVRRWLTSMQPHLGLLLAELDDAAQLREAAAVITTIDLPWVLVTTTPAGAAWGALFECGAREILPTTQTPEELAATLRRIRTDDPASASPDRQLILAAWQATDGHHRELTHRLETLSAREMEVLVELHDGIGVKAIAEHAGVTDGTVRSQVKAILRKLGVTSQLQAVASYRTVNAVIRG